MAADSAAPSTPPPPPTNVPAVVAPATPRQLPPPRLDAGAPLMQALKARRTQRQFSQEPLSPQLLGDLLWAAIGVNRPDSGRRTAPTACDWREIDVYVAAADGLFLYNPSKHALVPVLPADLRVQATVQTFAHPPPIVLIFVADLSRMKDAPETDRVFYSATDTGYVSQNVYLFAASEHLATVVCGMIDREILATAMKLRPAQNIILTQPIGHPLTPIPGE
jgi:nitroreductase